MDRYHFRDPIAEKIFDAIEDRAYLVQQENLDYDIKKHIQCKDGTERSSSGPRGVLFDYIQAGNNVQAGSYKINDLANEIEAAKVEQAQKTQGITNSNSSVRRNLQRLGSLARLPVVKDANEYLEEIDCSPDDTLIVFLVVENINSLSFREKYIHDSLVELQLLQQYANQSKVNSLPSEVTRSLIIEYETVYDSVDKWALPMLLTYKNGENYEVIPRCYQVIFEDEVTPQTADRNSENSLFSEMYESSITNSWSRAELSKKIDDTEDEIIPEYDENGLGVYERLKKILGALHFVDEQIEFIESVKDLKNNI